jgi:MFS family permease
MAKIKFSPMTRRLMPLYIAAVLQGIPFWYAIEKIFMLGIGFNTATIGIMVAIMSIVMLAVETPSGILADRWSRKGVMILGCFALIISGVLGAVSFNEPVYILSTVFWGIYAALYSGTYDSVIYDTTMEEYGDSKKFEKYLGRFRAVEGVFHLLPSAAGVYIF